MMMLVLMLLLMLLLMMMPTATTTTGPANEQRGWRQLRRRRWWWDIERAMWNGCAVVVVGLWLSARPVPFHPVSSRPVPFFARPSGLPALVPKKSTIIHLHNVRKVSGRRQRTKGFLFFFFLHGASALGAEAVAWNKSDNDEDDTLPEFWSQRKRKSKRQAKAKPARERERETESQRDVAQDKE